MEDQNQTKNLILAMALSMGVILIWSIMFPPETPPDDPNETGSEAVSVADETAPEVALVPPSADPADTSNTATDTAPEALSETPRIEIDTPGLMGSIALTGGRLDDLLLRNYTQELDPDSDNVRLLSPVGASGAYYALYGWTPGGALDYDQVPGANTEWQVEGGDVLTVETPVTLIWENEGGLVFRRTISIDEDYMFSVTQSVENTGTDTARLAPYGIVARHGLPDDLQNFFILHEGVVQNSDGTLNEVDYDGMTDMEFVQREGAQAEITEVTESGWIGFTDKYWMTTLVPGSGQPFTAVSRYVEGADIYQTEARMPAVNVAPGETVETTTRLFAGAKEWETIRNYEREEGVERFLDSIDWGWFFFLTKPIFWLLHNLNVLIGNMGVAIVALTLLIKAILFPLAYRSYVSMAKMKELQPEMEKLKERAGDDKEALQKGMMELYKKNKVNPASGCLPILLQIPIFFSLYKVIFVTLELRHAPFFGWLNDLSAPDTSSIYNFFGLMPWDAPDPGTIFALIFIGVLPILLGISMWLQQKLNPAPSDPTQQMIFAWMPWVFMFMLGSFASGLLVYWITNNTVTFAQQYIIMRSQGYKPDVFGNILSSFRKKKTEE
ncbi:membrane protein insertase YidC [Rhodobacteraceae bacterium W635]|uniref:membrane protein insertase YidC n=1 Tax=Nioella halotolerans TaxID=2303578 RepID=UPI000E3CC075|nr:membrane protein insertase YidC [Rhodobacteraceae bacterium W635]